MKFPLRRILVTGSALMVACSEPPLEPAWSLTLEDGLLVGLPSQMNDTWRLQGRVEGTWSTLGVVERGYDPNPVPYWLETSGDQPAPELLRWRSSSGHEVDVLPHTDPLLRVEASSEELISVEEHLGIRFRREARLMDSLDVTLRLTSEPSLAAESGWMRPTCREGDELGVCLGTAEETWGVLDDDGWQHVPDWSRYREWPTADRVSVELSTSAMSNTGRVNVRWLAWEKEYWSLGGRFVWGDPHAQSNLSWDGCEVETDDCGARYGKAASDFFEQARFSGLDFAAITDSSEAQAYYPSGILARQYPIWDGQIAAVQSTRRDDFLPLLGYEWSPHDLLRAEVEAPWHSGARVIIFADDDVCESYRISAQRAQVNFTKDNAVYTPSVGPVAGTAVGLYEALDEASAMCGHFPSVSFATHGTREPWVDWTSPKIRKTRSWKPSLRCTPNVDILSVWTELRVGVRRTLAIARRVPIEQRCSLVNGLGSSPEPILMMAGRGASRTVRALVGCTAAWIRRKDSPIQAV